MNILLEFINSDNFPVILGIFCIILFILYIINLIILIKTKNSYQRFMKKVGNGKSIQDTIENYMQKISDVEQENIEIKNYCKQLDNSIMKCIQKIGIVRYNAFKDTGSDLSFTLALLDEQNNGVVLNGIYSREISNIYAKPIQNGESTYTLSDEERQAIKKAINI